MPQTARELVDTWVHRCSHWAIHRPDGTIYIPVVIQDVRQEFGKIRCLARIVGTEEETWLDSSNLVLAYKEEVHVDTKTETNSN